MKDVSSLKKKLAGYSAMAGVMIAANHPKAAGQIIYHDIIPDTFVTDAAANLTYYLDMNNDGITDFWLTDQYSLSNSGFVKLHFNGGNSCIIQETNYRYIAALNPCDLVSANPQNGPYYTYWDTGSQRIMAYWFGVFGPWGNNYPIDKYAGVMLHLNDGNHYGWIRMSHHPNSDSLFIQDYAYEAIPDSSILTPCPTQIKEVAVCNLFNAFVDDHQLILHFHQSPLPSRMILFNELGVKMSEQSITQPVLMMDVSHLTAGIYFVEVNDAEKRQVKKVVIAQ